MIIIKNVLVATDFSEPSAVAMDYGRDLARSYDATLHVLHVVENVMVRYSPEVGLTSPVLQENLESAARHELAAVITDDDRRSLDLETAIRVSTSIAGGIVDYAREHAIDLIIVGTHGRSGMQHLLMGSVAERVVRTAPCPVLAVRERARGFLAPDALVASAKE